MATESRIFHQLLRNVYSKNIDGVAQCIANGIDVEQCTAREAMGGPSWDVIHVAARMGVPAIVDWLLDAGADVNAEMIQKGCPLHIAVEACDTDMVQLLIDRGALM